MEFSDKFQAALERLFVLRRDVRRFRVDPVDDALLEELLGVFDLAPSVGLSEPWRIFDIRDAALREKVRANFEAANSQALEGYSGEKAGSYARLKLSGLKEAPVHLAVFCDLNPDQGSGLGRQTMPETLEYSVVVAITLMWLAARARGIGLGWVSILDATAMAEMLDAPENWKLVAYLCLGWPEDEQVDRPELETKGWERRTGLKNKLIRR